MANMHTITGTMTNGGRIINTVYPGNGYVTWSAATTAYANPYEPMFDLFRKRDIQGMAQEASEELDNLLDDYLEELRASEEEDIKIADVIKALQTMQQKVQAKLRENEPQVDVDFPEWVQENAPY